MDPRHDGLARADGRAGACSPLRISGRFRWLRLGLSCLGLYLGLVSPGSLRPGPRPADAQPVPRAAPAVVPQPGSLEPGRLDAAQLERLVAPIALFDDELLLDTLDASRHPVQVLQARRFVRQGGGADPQIWAPSVRELLRLPRVLDMLADHPAWAERLGRAYEEQGPEWMDAVQRLRWRALEAGTLDPTDERVVHIEDGVISIHAAGWTAVPEYDPWCVYGAWPAAPAQGFDYQPLPPDCAFTPGQALVLVEPVPLLAGRWVWGAIDWRSRRVLVDRDQWRRHAPGHALPPGWSPRPPRPPAQPLQPRPPVMPPVAPVPPPVVTPEPLRRGPGMRMPAPGQVPTPVQPIQPPARQQPSPRVEPRRPVQPSHPVQTPRAVPQPGRAEAPVPFQAPRPAQGPRPAQPPPPRQGPAPQGPHPRQGPGPVGAPHPAPAARPAQPRLPDNTQPQRPPQGGS